MIGPIRPPSRGSLDVLRLDEVGALYRERTRGAVAEAGGAKSFAIGFAFGGITIFGVIAWLATGAVKL